MSLIDEDKSKLIDTDTYITSSLNYSDFDTPPATLAPPFSDYGVDNNTDGKYDWLVVNVTLNINKNDSYKITGSLFPYNWSSTLEIINYVDDFEVGNPTIKLWFNVTEHSEEVGPYDVVVMIGIPTQTYDEVLYTASVESFEY